MIVAGYVLCGMGLIFLGIKLISIYLKNSSTFTLKEKMTALTKNPILGFFFGGVLMILTQSASAAILMLICTLKAGMLKLRNCFPVVTGIHIVGSATVFILAFDIKTFIYFALGISALVFTCDVFYKYRNIAGIFIGIGLLFLGLYTVQGGVVGLRDVPWFNNAILFVNKSYILGIIIGAALTLVTQSSLAVRAILMVLYKSDVINLHAAMILTYGAFLGSSFLTILLTLNISGEVKQIVMFNVLFNVVGNIILIPLLYIENHYNIPVIGALVVFLFDNKGFQVAALGLLFHSITGIAMGLLVPLLSRKLAKLYPESIEESISKPQYLFSKIIPDMSSAMKLVEFEQARVIEANTYIFTLLREGKNRNNIEQSFDAIMDLVKLIKDYLSALPKKYLVEVNMCYKLGILFDIQNSIEMLTIAIKNLSHILVEKTLFTGKEKLDFYNAIIEGIDTQLIITSDVLHDRESSFAEYITKMTIESEKEINAMRRNLINSLKHESSSVKFKLLSVICDCEKIMMLLNKITEKISVLKSEQKLA